MKKILIADDRAEIRKLVQMTLELGEYEFMEAADGASALHMIRTSKPDVVLLDIMMPGGDRRPGRLQGGQGRSVGEIQDYPADSTRPADGYRGGTQGGRRCLPRQAL